MVASQDVAITSPVPGTTTDVVEKSMELPPLGPVVFLDTAGLDDTSILAELRLKKTTRIFDRADVIVVITEPDLWDEYEDRILQEAKERNTPYIIVINKTDLKESSAEFLEELKKKSERILLCSSIDSHKRDKYINEFKRYLIQICPDEFLNPPPLIGDLLTSGGIAVLVVPIDLQAPRGRLILPQVQTIRDVLDNDGAALVVKEREYAHILKNLKNPPDISVCDSQVVLKMVADTPEDIKCTTFSILFARYKGDIVEAARGACVIDKLKPGDKILIGEACSHHPIEDDIGRVKIPRWLRQHIGEDIQIDVSSGRDYPENLKEYKLIIHCGGCMLTRREMLWRIHKARQEGVPVTNYGLCISFIQGVIERVLSPFPAALDAYRKDISLKE